MGFEIPTRRIVLLKPPYFDEDCSNGCEIVISNKGNDSRKEVYEYRVGNPVGEPPIFPIFYGNPCSMSGLELVDYAKSRKKIEAKMYQLILAAAKRFKEMGDTILNQLPSRNLKASRDLEAIAQTSPSCKGKGRSQGSSTCSRDDDDDDYPHLPRNPGGRDDD